MTMTLKKSLGQERVAALEAMGDALAALTRCKQVVAPHVDRLQEGAPGTLEWQQFLTGCLQARDALCTAIRRVPDSVPGVAEVPEELARQAVAAVAAGGQAPVATVPEW